MSLHILARVQETFLLHALDFFARQTVIRDDLERGPLPAPPLLRRNIQHAARINQKLHLELWYPGGHRRDAAQMELAEFSAVRRHLALALKNRETDRRLVINTRRKELAGLRRDGAVPDNQLGNRTADSLDSERKRDDIEQERALGASDQDGGLHRGAESDDLIRIDRNVRFEPEKLAHFPANQRRARHSADHDHALDLRRRRRLQCPRRIRERTPAVFDRALNQRREEHFILLTHDRRTDRSSRQREFGFAHFILAQPDFQQLGLVPQDSAIGGRQDRGITSEQQSHQRVVGVVTSQMRIARRRQHLEEARLAIVTRRRDAQDRNIERAAAQVIDRDDPLAGRFFRKARSKPVRECRGSRLVHDPDDVEPRKPARILCRLTLRIIEIRRHGNDGA